MGKDIKCEHCGNKNDIDSKFCSKCGNELKPVAGETKLPRQPKNIQKTNSREDHLGDQSQDSGTPPKKSTTKSAIASLLKVSIITTLVSLIIFSFTLDNISVELNYSKALILTLAFVALAFAGITLFFIVKNFKASKTKSTIKFLTTLFLIFITFSISAFKEKGRIIKLERSYQDGTASMNSKDWRAAISSFGYVSSNSKNFKNVASLLDSSQSILNHLVADSSLQAAKNMIAKYSFYDAISAIDKAKSLMGNDPKVNNAYYLASTGLLIKAEQEYRKEKYENAVNYAKQSLKQMTDLPKNSFRNLSDNIKKANDISNKAQSKLTQIRKAEQRKRQKELAAFLGSSNKFYKSSFRSLSNNIKKANDISNKTQSKLAQIRKAEQRKRQKKLAAQQARERALEAAAVEKGREMAAAFSILAVQGKKDNIGWSLQYDLTNTLSEFGYYGYTVYGGTKIELYDGIIYQAECTKNNKYYYAYMKSNLAYDRWWVTGVYIRSY